MTRLLLIILKLILLPLIFMIIILMLIMTRLLLIIFKLTLLQLIFIWRCLVSCGTLSGPRTLGRPRRDTKAKAAGAKPECKTKNASRAGACARHPRSFRFARAGTANLSEIVFRNSLVAFSQTTYPHRRTKTLNIPIGCFLVTGLRKTYEQISGTQLPLRTRSQSLWIPAVRPEWSRMNPICPQSGPPKAHVSHSPESISHSPNSISHSPNSILGRVVPYSTSLISERIENLGLKPRDPKSEDFNKGLNRKVPAWGTLARIWKSGSEARRPQM